MAVLHAGEIGRFDEAVSTLDDDNLAVLRNGVLLRVSAETLAQYVTTKNTAVKEITADYSVLNSDDTIKCVNTTAITVTLLESPSEEYDEWNIKVAGTAQVTLVVSGGIKTIDDVTSIIIPPKPAGQYTNLHVKHDGTNYMVL